jgi:hypothetical protein
METNVRMRLPTPREPWAGRLPGASSQVNLGRSSELQVMSTSKLSTLPQSAAERRSAEAELRTLVAKFAPEHLRLIAAIRRSLRKRLPTAHEVVYEYRAWFVISYSPSEQGYEGVLAIRADAAGVKLYFNRGKELPDPEKLLQGSGGLVRSIDVEGASTLARPAVATLIDEAIARNRVPFARAGRGPVVIRRASVKQPGRRRPA